MAVRLSQSSLWQLQKEAYAALGVKSWSKERVPFHMTNNSKIAAEYAKIAEAAFGKRPFTVCEFGGGCGKFAFLLLGELKRRKMLVRYLLTDAAESNVSYWKKHPLLSEYIEQGLLETAHLDPLSMPIPRADFWIANYFFDSIPHDLFRVQKGVLFEGLVGGSFREVQGDAYPDFPEANQTLLEYRACFESLDFLFPIGALRTLHKVDKDSFFIAADRGPATPNELKTAINAMSQHGRAFSLPVNFDALGRFAKLRGMHVAVQGESAFRAALFSPIELPVFSTIGFGPLKREASSWKEILERLEEANWDATLFFSFFDRIQEGFPLASEEEKKSMLAGMRRIEERFFPLFREEAILLERLGLFFELLGEQRTYSSARFRTLPHQGAGGYLDAHPPSGDVLQIGEGDIPGGHKKLPWGAVVIGMFDTIYLFPPEVQEKKAPPPFVREIEQKFGLATVVYSDADIEGFFTQMVSNDPTAVLRFFAELERRKNISKDQLERIEKRLGMKAPEEDRFFETLLLCLEHHLRPGGVLYAFLPGLAAYGDARFYDRIVVDPHLETEETEESGGVWIRVQKG